MSPLPNDIKLLLSDVDGTLVTREKVLTQEALGAVRDLRAAGIQFAVTSGRPPRGMQMFIQPLGLTTPIAAFNGGMFVRSDLSVIEQHVLNETVVAPVIATMTKYQLDVWIYRGNDWYVRSANAPHVAREEWTVKFPPTVVGDFTDKLDKVVKVVGVSDEVAVIAGCEIAIRNQFAQTIHSKQSSPERVPVDSISAARSQPYYLDVTHAEANKGAVVHALSRMLNIPTDQIATIGDMPNDTFMFEQSGVSIAMGQSSEEVKTAATYVTGSSEEEGFATAIRKFLLQRGQ